MNRPLWGWLPAKLAHDLAPLALELYARQFANQILEWDGLSFQGIQFPNRLGIAGGVDKNAKLAKTWPRLGAGFVEFGTITPRPQKANPGRILDRDWKRLDLWNKMGFPNQGSDILAQRLKKEWTRKTVPWLVNIGKNRETPAELASQDYQLAVDRLKEYADIFVVNVSSPNTKGLRELQASEHLAQIVKAVVSSARPRPVLIKLSPDLSEAELKDSVLAAAAQGAQGFILTNTTLWRPSGSKFPNEGGLSGRDLGDFSKRALIHTIKALGSERKNFLLISAGGVLTAQDYKERLSLGADLVQIYSALVFRGPGFFREVAKVLSQPKEGQHEGERQI